MNPDGANFETAAVESDFDRNCELWISEISKGQEKALEKLYTATLSRLFAIAVKILDDSALAEDVVTESYHEIWRHAARYDRAKGRPITWMMTICRNRALDAYRRRAADARKLENAATLEHEAVADVAEDLMGSLRDDTLMRALLEQVSSEDRQLIALAFFRDYSHQEIADFSGLPLGTVKSRIRRALKNLAPVLEADRDNEVTSP